MIPSLKLGIRRLIHAICIFLVHDVLNQFCKFQSLLLLFCIAECPQNGNYEGNGIDDLNDIDSSLKCQAQCQSLSSCQFWTWDFSEQKCYRHTANAPEKQGTHCGNNCRRGPRDCQGGIL